MPLPDPAAYSRPRYVRTEATAEIRQPRLERWEGDLVVSGGGLAGTCCAISAARAGLRVCLVQDRPVLGGNASSEVRLWALGATVHMGTNNRWARETGVVGEFLEENLWRNREGNPILVDPILLEMAVAEPNLTLLLNTAVDGVEKASPSRIQALHAFCPQNSTRYLLQAPLFVDATGDGLVGFMAGAAFRQGAESAEEFGESLAPPEEFGSMLGDSIYFYTRDAGNPVEFVPPSFALENIPGRIPRFRRFSTKTQGCSLWWIEFGGRLDTIHAAEAIKWELWRIVYGVWDYIKNSGNFPEAANLTLDWVGLIPGKRESRRFEGPYMMVQRDILSPRGFPDTVAYGGWSIDLHPADGVYSEFEGSLHAHPRAPYPVPFRSLYSANIENLFLGGRLLSASHVAFGSTRVMLTLALCGQAIGHAASLCRAHDCHPSDLAEDATKIEALQRSLLRSGQYLPGCSLRDVENLIEDSACEITTSTTFVLDELAPSGETLDMARDWALLLPVGPGPFPTVICQLDLKTSLQVTIELRRGAGPGDFSPDRLLASRAVALPEGTGIPLRMEFPDAPAVTEKQYAFYVIRACPEAALHLSATRLTGLLTVFRNEQNTATYKDHQDVENWKPDRRPHAGSHLPAMRVEPPLRAHEPESMRSGLDRPVAQPNGWLPALRDKTPVVTFAWPEPVEISLLALAFDADFDHAMESVLRGHPERVGPSCVRHYRILDETGQVLAEVEDNHRSLQWHKLSEPIQTRQLRVEILSRWDTQTPPAIMAVRAYSRDVRLAIPEMKE